MKAEFGSRPSIGCIQQSDGETECIQEVAKTI